MENKYRWMPHRTLWEMAERDLGISQQHSVNSLSSMCQYKAIKNFALPYEQAYKIRLEPQYKALAAGYPFEKAVQIKSELQYKAITSLGIKFEEAIDILNPDNAYDSFHKLAKEKLQNDIQVQASEELELNLEQIKQIEYETQIKAMKELNFPFERSLLITSEEQLASSSITGPQLSAFAHIQGTQLTACICDSLTSNDCMDL